MLRNLGSQEKWWRRWKNINREETKRNYRKLNDELRREHNKAKEEWMKQKCEEIEELE